MKKILFLFMAIVGFAACGNNGHTTVQSIVKSQQKEFVEVLYFHGKQRCITCNTIERLTKELLEQEFADELASGKVVFSVIDLSSQEGEKMADTYEVTWSSLFINQWKEGKETPTNMTDFGFSYAKNSPEQFKVGVKKKMDELLK